MRIGGREVEAHCLLYLGSCTFTWMWDSLLFHSVLPRHSHNMA